MAVEPQHLRMARTSGAQGLGFDLDPPPPPAPKNTPSLGDVKTKPFVQKTEEYVDEDDVKYEVCKEDAKDQIAVIRAATLERLVLIISFYFCLFFVKTII
jgi:hypothetical protein